MQKSSFHVPSIFDEIVCLSLQGPSGNAPVPEHRGPVSAQGFVQEEPCQQTGLLSASVLHVSLVCEVLAAANCACFTGSGADGAEEIKRHGFFSTIDWNVSVCCSVIL